MNFEIIGEIRNVEVIAVGNSIREVERLRKNYFVPINLPKAAETVFFPLNL